MKEEEAKGNKINLTEVNLEAELQLYLNIVGQIFVMALVFFGANPDPQMSILPWGNIFRVFFRGRVNIAIAVCN